MKRKKGESQYSYNLAKNSEIEYKKVHNKAMKNYRKKMTKKMQNVRSQNTGEFSTNMITQSAEHSLFRFSGFFQKPLMYTNVSTKITRNKDI
jgi:hypothetical protein